LITLRAGVFDVGQGLTLRGWFGPVTIYEIVIVILFTISIPALVLLALRERRELAVEDPPRDPMNDSELPLNDAVGAVQR
jgi:hypothetical protein